MSRWAENKLGVLTVGNSDTKLRQLKERLLPSVGKALQTVSSGCKRHTGTSDMSTSGSWICHGAWFLVTKLWLKLMPDAMWFICALTVLNYKALKSEGDILARSKANTYPTGNSRPFGNLLTLKWDKLMLCKLVIHTSLWSASCKLVELSCPRSCGWREGWKWGCCC